MNVTIKPLIYYIQGVCSSGKTHWIIQHMVKGHRYLNKDKRFLFVSPSTPLSKEVHKKLSEKGFKCITINHTSTHSSVGEEILDNLNFYKDKTNICLIITNQGYDSITNYCIEENGFQVIYDESQSKTNWWEFSIDDTIKMGSIFNFARNTGIMTLKKHFQKAHHSIVDPFSDIRNNILNMKRVVYCLPYKNGENIRRYNDNLKRRKWQEITVVSVPKINYFPTNTVILTANTMNCDFYNAYKDKIDVKEIIMDNRIKGKKLKIVCFTDKQINSTSLKKSNREFVRNVFNFVKSDMKRGLIFRNIAEKQAKNDGMFYYPNMSEPIKLPPINEKWIDIPSNVIGQNAYNDHHAIFLLGTLNPPNKIFKELREREGKTKEEYYYTTVIETYHQMIMRTSLRDPECTERVTAYVIDKDTAELLQYKFSSEYDMDVEIEYKEEFDTVSGVKQDYLKDGLDDNEYNRIAYLVKKAVNGKIKDKDSEFEILRLSKNGKIKSDPRILEIDRQHELLTGEKI